MTVVDINEALRAGDQDVAPEFSEEALALDFALSHANKVRYVAAWNKWFIWDGTCWHMDETRKVFSLARKLCRDTAGRVNKPSERKRIASAKTGRPWSHWREKTAVWLPPLSNGTLTLGC